MRRTPRRRPDLVSARGLAAAAVALCPLLAAGCGEEPPPAPEVVRPVKMLTIQAGGAATTREYPGRVKATRTAEMAFEVPGKIVEFPVGEGEEVAEGALLARLDPRDYTSELDKQRAQVAKTQADYERYQKLFDAGVSPRADLETYKRNYDVAVANLRQAEKAVSDATLHAPFDGIVARKLVEDFANVKAKEVVLVVTDESSLEVKLSVPERDLSGAREKRSLEEISDRIRPEVVITSIPDRRFGAKLTELASTADPETRTFEATVAFEPPSGVRVLPGMTANVIIHLPQDVGGGGVRIPATAAQADDAGRPFVWIVDPQTLSVSRRPVELGQVFGSEVAVTGGLEAGDVVAVSGASQLRDGMIVRRFEP